MSNSRIGQKIDSVLLVHASGFDSKYVSNIKGPFVLLWIGAALKKLGIRTALVDLFVQDTSELHRVAADIKPSVVILAGPAAAYRSAVRITSDMKRAHSSAIYVAAEPLSSTYEMLFEDQAVDYVLHGEIEVSLPKFVRFLESGKTLAEIGGISFPVAENKPYLSGADHTRWMANNEVFARTRPELLVEDLDDCGFPDYSLIDLEKYVIDLKDWYSAYKPSVDMIAPLKAKVDRLIAGGRTKYIEWMVTGRGCTHRCRFCYRQMSGFRSFSVGHVIEHLRMLKSRARIDGVNFIDDLFNPETDRVHQLCDAFDASGLGFSFFMAGANRSDKIDDTTIARMAKSNFINVTFGQESGADEVLRYYGKGTDVEQNIKSVLLTRKHAINTTVQLVIGSPVETMSTIRKTGRFLKAIGVSQASIKYVTPLPGAAIWSEAVKIGAITDVRAYLDKVNNGFGSYFLGVNLSAASKLEWIFWHVYLERVLYLNRFKAFGLKRFYYWSYMFKAFALIKSILRRVFKTKGIADVKE